MEKKEFDEEREQKKSKVEYFLIKAEEFISENKVKAAFQMLRKAVNIYFYIGQYMKIPEVLSRITNLFYRESIIYNAISYLNEVYERLAKLDLPEEEAKILMEMAKLSKKIGDYESAADYFEQCAELYLQADPELYRSVSAMFLISAAGCYERNRSTHRKGEMVIIQAALRLNKEIFDYQAAEYQGIKYLKSKELDKAIEIYEKLYKHFVNALSNLSQMVNESAENEINYVSIFAKTRMIHIISEYRLILMFLYDLINEKEKSKEMALESIDDLNSGIELIKGMIASGYWSMDDLKRLTYEGFMRAYFQKYWHIKDPSPEDEASVYIIDGLPKPIVEKIKNLPYYDLCVKTETYSLESLNELLADFHLGRLEKYKEYFINPGILFLK
ncbi:MAG: hypothetical protein ACTSRZ_18800 [Promethearchaeota archaeon]